MGGWDLKNGLFLAFRGVTFGSDPGNGTTDDAGFGINRGPGLRSGYLAKTRLSLKGMLGI